MYITTIKRNSIDVFKPNGKETHMTVECKDLISAVHCFVLMTGSADYKAVTLHSEQPPAANIHEYDLDRMSSDEFLIMNL